jgi:hypothetical protein
LFLLETNKDIYKKKKISTRKLIKSKKKTIRSSAKAIILAELLAIKESSKPIDSFSFRNSKRQQFLCSFFFLENQNK